MGIRAAFRGRLLGRTVPLTPFQTTASSKINLMTTSDDPNPSLPSKESISKATSELNNLLQIISGTSSALESGDENPNSKEYMEMLRLSIARAEKVAADLAGQAGGATEKVALQPELAAFIRNRKEPENTGPTKQSIMLVDDEQMALTLVKRVLSEAGFSEKKRTWVIRAGPRGQRPDTVYFRDDPRALVHLTSGDCGVA